MKGLSFKVGLEVLLIMIPVAAALWWFEASPILVFASAALAIVPLSKIVGGATESLAAHIGPTLGGLLNASMGNAPELIIGFFALKNGLIQIVKASLTGSILGNLLLTLGLAMFVGGISQPVQRYNVRSARLSMTMMMLAVVGVMVPALFHFSSPAAEQEISLKIAVILLVVYGLSLIYTLSTHRKLFETAGPRELKLESDRSWQRAAGELALATLALAFMSEILTDSLEPATTMMRLNPVFAGIILLASVSNVSSIMNAIVFARKNQMDLVVGSVIGAATQIALLVAPALVLASLFTHDRMDLLFTRLEIVSVAIAVILVNNVTLDGESDWLEGAMLVAVFAMLGVGFFFLKVH